MLPVVWQLEGFAQGVNDPSQDELAGAPGAIAGQELLDRGGLLTVGFLVGGRLKHFVDAMEEKSVHLSSAVVLALN